MSNAFNTGEFQIAAIKNPFTKTELETILTTIGYAILLANKHNELEVIPNLANIQTKTLKLLGRI